MATTAAWSSELQANAGKVIVAFQFGVEKQLLRYKHALKGPR
jgi:hypothetical protein